MAVPQSPRIWATSSSTCTLERAGGAHFFRIDGYSLCKGLGKGNFIPSATFAIGGHDWRLLFYPDGDTEARNGSISVHLELMDEGVEVRALYDLTLFKQAEPTSGCFVWTKPTEPVVFSRSPGKTSHRGHSNFAGRSMLEAWSYLYFPRDVLIVKCKLLVIKLKEAQIPKTRMNFETIQVPPSDLSHNLGSLLEAGEESDVSFKVKDEVFTAHKIVLAMRSPVFKAELYGPMRDKCRQSIAIEDMEPAVFKALLHFIYTDELPPMDDLDGDDDKEEMVKHLLVASDRYAMERMKLMCERKLCKFLDAKTVAATLALADQYHCSKLKDACIGFINSLDRMDEVMTSTGYQHLKRACPTICIDMWENAAKARKI
ncbi:BTB/POZ and MATH domain-containing protein 1-like [Triticum urartu]|nr:BTB/POZ and MATH domain-containing protein 1-like [Triticum urartu]XP_048543579.1 BTB/POZ and MATH domain-containing protein 1-like [Triticum urartu]